MPLSREQALDQRLRRLLTQFDLKGWPGITVCVNGMWCVGQVDDEARDALEAAQHMLERQRLAEVEHE